MMVSEQQQKDKEYRKRYYQKKIKEDPDYFRRINAEWRRKNPEKAKEHHRKWRINNPLSYSKSYAKWQTNNQAKSRAKIYAQRYGKLKDNCEICGATEKLEGHHDDYSKPLNVRTLCKNCHEALHRQLSIEGKNIPKPNPIVFLNRHCSTCRKTHPECGRGHPSYNGRPCSRWQSKQRMGVSEGTKEGKVGTNLTGGLDTATPHHCIESKQRVDGGKQA